jgi:hypothetical protein
VSVAALQLLVQPTRWLLLLHQLAHKHDVQFSCTRSSEKQHVNAFLDGSGLGALKWTYQVNIKQTHHMQTADIYG